MSNAEEKRDMGERGELLASAIMRRHGYSYVNIAAGGPRGASLVRQWQGTLVSPDGMMVRTRPMLVEIKTKTCANESRGGSPGSNWMRAGVKFHGIDRANHEAYRLASEQLAMPLVVLLICIEDAVLVGATLQELGTPFPSLLPQVHDLVDFPISRFTVLTEFHPKRLKRYFAEPLQNLTEHRMRQFVLWLGAQSQQRAFYFVDFMTFDNADPRWGRQGPVAATGVVA
jgi:hypothetical protein